MSKAEWGIFVMDCKAPTSSGNPCPRPAAKMVTVGGERWGSKTPMCTRHANLAREQIKREILIPVEFSIEELPREEAE